MQNNLYQVRVNCRICGSDRLTKILSLGETPLADRFVKDAKEDELKFPLDVSVCNDCFLVQLIDEVGSNILFGGNDYAFYTGGSPSSLKYFETYAKSVMERFSEQCKRGILEIASNDGTLLKHFIDKGYKSIGIDPAKNVADYANKQGVITIADFFNKETAKKNFSNEKVGIIMANNVVAHVEDIHDFMDGVQVSLDSDGVFIFECQYFPYLLFNNQFDNVYHEHRAFLSLLPLITLFKHKDLEIFDVEEHDTQGGSIRVFVGHKGKHDVSENFIRMGLAEYMMGLHKMETYMGFAARVEYIRIKLNKILSDLKQKGKIIHGYGASAKSNTLLNYCGIGTNYLDKIVDKTPYKYGLYTPGTHIPVVDQDTVDKPDYYLLLVWNYAAGILVREAKYRENGGKFIIPIPTPHIV